MELKEGCEKYADNFILKAYANGGSIVEEGISFSIVPSEYKTGTNTLLLFYGTLEPKPTGRTYTLNKDGMEFARKGAFAGVVKKEYDEIKHNRQTRIIAISGFAIATIVAIFQIYDMLKGYFF